MRLFLFLLLGCLTAAAASKPESWGAIDYLLGDWTGEGGGGPGQGTGSFSFRPDLQGKVLVRTNRSAYPATRDRAAFVHDDLMVVYRDSLDAPPHAIYFDSEGHTIRYEVQSSKEGDAIAFVSAPETNAPRYRLTYTRVDRDHLKIKFEVAPPGQPDRFATYIEAGARRQPKQP
jgi:hypothetical protein